MKVDYLKIKKDYLKTYLRQQNNPNVLFVWIPKTAGTSLYNALDCALGMELYLCDTSAKNGFVNKGMVSFGHMDIGKLVGQEIISRSYLERAFVFAVCRNPFDRFVSLLHYLRNTERIPKGYQAIDLIRDVIKGIDAVDLYNFKGLSQCNPQVDWLTGFEIDKVFKFEEMDLCIKRLEYITGKSLVLQHDNLSKDRKSVLEELDACSIKLIKDYYEADFVRFNYAMDL